METILWAIISALILTNAVTLYWAIRKRMPSSPEAKALFRALHAFERENSTVLRIEKINPDNIFLRNPAER